MQSRAPFIRIGTRGSALALAQANLVRQRLAAMHGVSEDDIAVRVITTSGDRLTDRPLAEAGGKGLFSKEIEAALLAGEVDLGVHSSKDIATTLPDGLRLAAFLEREDVRDAFVSLTAATLDDLPAGARFGTSSIRRGAQMKRARPDLEIVPFRGNVGTRLEKLQRGVADATQLAVAGLRRLGQADRITSVLDPRRFPPAPAQGAIGLELRAADERTAGLVAGLDHPATSTAVIAERALLAVLNGSCRTPIGVFTELNETSCTMHAQVLSPDGSQSFEATLSGGRGEAASIGAELGRHLLALAGPKFVARFGG
ncbi:hydroxymethylbilane synthase [Devosia sp.]|uniref:hydroxymethylbilane synthase n=1 Tax=Devosia sp. TaxID=1871048 RepID=UPI002F0D61D6